LGNYGNNVAVANISPQFLPNPALLSLLWEVKATVCKGEGRDLGELQVLAGMVLDCPRYSKGQYDNMTMQRK